MSRVIIPDLELFLTGYLRRELHAAGHDVEVSNREPAELVTPLERPLIIIRDDGGLQQSQISYQRQIGISTLAGTASNSRPASNLARIALAILTDPAIALAEGSPIAAVEVLDTNGPFWVDDPHPVSRYYATTVYTIIGQW